MPAIFLRQELFHQMFAVSDTAMFSKRLLNCSSSGKMIPWLPSQKHGVKNRCEISLFILLKCWMALPENRLFLHQELGWEMAFHWRTSSWRGQMEHPKTAAQKWWGNTIGNPEPFPQESPESEFSVHSSLPPILPLWQPGWAWDMLLVKGGRKFLLCFSVCSEKWAF